MFFFFLNVAFLVFFFYFFMAGMCVGIGFRLVSLSFIQEKKNDDTENVDMLQ